MSPTLRSAFPWQSPAVPGCGREMGENETIFRGPVRGNPSGDITNGDVGAAEGFPSPASLATEDPLPARYPGLGPPTAVSATPRR